MFPKKRKISNITSGMDEEFIAHQFALYQMCGMDDTIFNYYDKRTQCLPRTLSAVLVNIDEFASLEEHFEWISQNKLRGIDATVFSACIKDLRESGLLITKNEALAKLRAENFIKNDEKISTATWVTKDRADSLIGSMESFIANFKKHGHPVRIFISDDSPDRVKSEALSDRLTAIAKREALSMVYMDLRERRKLRDTILAQASPDHLPAGVLDFALFGSEGIFPSYGANRNAVLLANAGEMILSSDDDVYCNLRIPENDEYDLELTSYVRSSLRESFQDRNTLDRMHPAEDGDILEYHNRLLGRHTSEILRGLMNNSKISLKQISPSNLNLLLQQGGVVKVTAAGSAGDSGMVTPRYFFNQTEASLNRCNATEEIFRKTFQSRLLLQSSSHFSLGFRAFFLGMNMGIDNRGITPPFIPIFRGEDTIFSRMIKVIAENTLIGTIPASITHTPVYPRINEENIFLDVRPELCGIIVLLLKAYDYPAGNKSSASRMTGLGTYLSDLGSLPLEEFEEYAKHLWFIREMQTIRDLERLLAEHDYKPAYWNDLIENFLFSIRDFSCSNYITAVRDVYDGNEQMAATVCRDTVRQYGELLKWWPTIFKTAKCINLNK